MVPKRVAALVRENTQAQNDVARHRRSEQKVRSCSGGYSHNICSLGGFRCHRKSIAIHSTGLVLATKIEGSRKDPPRRARRAHSIRGRERTGEPSIPAIPMLISKATGQTSDRIRPDRAIVADHKARARAQPLSSFVMLRGPVRIEGAARNCQGRCNPQRMGFPPVTAMVAPET
jgi:hypothetical protein